MGRFLLSIVFAVMFPLAVNAHDFGGHGGGFHGGPVPHVEVPHNNGGHFDPFHRGHDFGHEFHHGWDNSWHRGGYWRGGQWLWNNEMSQACYMNCLAKGVMPDVCRADPYPFCN